MTPSITAFARSPDRGRGLARDMRVRWALEEAGQPYNGNADWLDGAFSAGDLLMVTVLRRLTGSGLVEEHPNLSAYVARAEARPAYQRAFDDQLAVFTASAPAG